MSFLPGLMVSIKPGTQQIIRCLKRYVAREIWALLKPLRQPPVETSAAS